MQYTYDDILDEDLAGHHLHELVKVEGAAPVLVHLLNDVVQVAIYL
jgi:hypothetical protein